MFSVRVVLSLKIFWTSFDENDLLINGLVCSLVPFFFFPLIFPHFLFDLFAFCTCIAISWFSFVRSFRFSGSFDRGLWRLPVGQLRNGLGSRLHLMGAPSHFFLLKPKPNYGIAYYHCSTTRPPLHLPTSWPTWILSLPCSSRSNVYSNLLLSESRYIRVICVYYARYTPSAFTYTHTLLRGFVFDYVRRSLINYYETSSPLSLINPFFLSSLEKYWWGARFSPLQPQFENNSFV